MNFRKFILIMVVILNQSFAQAAIGVSVECKISPGSATFKAETKSVLGKAILNSDKSVMVENISVDLKSLTTDMSLRDDHMKNKYLEVDKFPEAILTIAKGKDDVGEGKIRIRGIEKDVKGTFKIINENELQAVFDLNLSDFDIKGIRHLGIGVKDVVKVTATIPYENKK